MVARYRSVRKGQKWHGPNGLRRVVRCALLDELTSREFSRQMVQTTRLRRAAPWLGGIAVAVLVLGPALGPGSLLNLDLVFAPTIPVPRGVWALGPELSRRVPLGVVLAWASTVVGGPVAGKVLLGVALGAAFVGVWRLMPDGGLITRAGAALLYAASPFILTRVAGGH